MARHNTPHVRQKASMSDDGPAYTSERLTALSQGRPLLLSYHVYIETFFPCCPYTSD
jgi:hypothetical protein